MAIKNNIDERTQLTVDFYKKCSADFYYFCRKSLKIRDKSGVLQPLNLNNTQDLVFQSLEHQLKETGMIRAVILKGRQQGVSTVITAYYFWKLLHHQGLKAFILTHLSESTQALFSMVKRYFDNLPLYRPELTRSNNNELYFGDIDCGYKVGTAGSTGVGRGETFQLFHGSEAAYWPNGEEHFAGIMQAVPNSKGSMIILESTANQTGNVFYRMCSESMKPNNNWKLIFAPWFNEPEYSMNPNANFSRTTEEEEIKDIYKLSDSQILWRRKKIEELGDVRKFKQEYPCSINEAFIIDTPKSFIMAHEIDKASTEKNPIVGDKMAPVLVGIDPAGKGKDASAYAVRVGRVLQTCKEFPQMNDTMELVAHIKILIQKYNPDRVFIDVGGLGAPIYDRLKEFGYRMLEPVNFQERPDDVMKYANKRAEMYDRLKQWLNSPPCQIPDDDALRMELGLTEWGTNSSGKLLLSPKRNLIKSPNLADAFALTFASNVPSNYVLQNTSMLTSKTDWNPFNNEW